MCCSNKNQTPLTFCGTSCIHQLKTNNTWSMCTAHFSSTEPLWWNPPLWLLPLLSVHISFIFSRALLYSAFCFKAATLITLAHDVSFAWRLSLQPAIGEYWERWFVLMMGGDEGEMTKGGKMIWDRRRGGAVKRNVADEPQIMAQMKLIQPFTF